MAKAADTKSKITDVFISLYSKKPIDNIHVMDICEACGISRGTFYYHYSDVIAICEELEAQIIRDMEDDLEKTIMFSFFNQTNQSNLDLWIDAYTECLKKYEEKQALYSCLMNGSHGKQFINKWIVSVRTKCEINFSYINLPAQNQEWMGTFLAAGLVNMLGRWIDRKCVDDPRVIAETFARVLFKGSIILYK